MCLPSDGEFKMLNEKFVSKKSNKNYLLHKKLKIG